MASVPAPTSPYRQPGHNAPQPAQWPLFELLQGPGPVSVQEMTARGIRSPGLALYELELAGCRVERVYGRGSSGRRRLLGYRMGRRR